jgi:hypothetical protein
LWVKAAGVVASDSPAINTSGCHPERSEDLGFAALHLP